MVIVFLAGIGKMKIQNVYLLKYNSPHLLVNNTRGFPLAETKDLLQILDVSVHW